MPQDILITPNRGSTTSGAQIAFTGYSGAAPIYLKVLPDSTLSFEGTAGQLLSISDNLTSGTIFSVSDITGIPSIDADANGLVRLVPFGGNVALGTTATSGRLQINTGTQNTIGLIVQGASGQTSNYTEWRNNSGTVVNSINSSGYLGIGTSAQNRAAIIAMNGVSPQLSIYKSPDGTLNAAQLCAAIGTGSSNTNTGTGGGNEFGIVQLWHNNTARVQLYASTAVDGNWILDPLGIGTVGSQSGQLRIGIGTTTRVGIIVVGATSQTANLQEWQNSAGTMFARVNASGEFFGLLSSGIVTSGAIASGQIGINHLASGVLSTAVLGSGQVVSGNIASGQIGRFHLSSGAVNSGHIGNNAVTSGNIASGAIGQMHLSSGTVSSGQIANNAVVSGSIASGSIGTFHISSGAVTSGEIGNNAVVSGSIASGQISQFHIASGVLAATSLSSGQVVSGNIGNNAVVSGSIASGQIFTFHIASGGLLSGAIGSGQIGQFHLSSGAVNSGHIGNNAVVSGSIASGQIFTFHIVNGGLLSGAIGSGQIGQAHLASGAIISGDIGNAAVVSGSIGSGQVGTFHLASGTAISPTNISGTLNYVPKFTGTSVLGTSQVYDNGTSVGIATATPSGKLDIKSPGNGQWGLLVTNSTNTNYLFGIYQSAASNCGVYINDSSGVTKANFIAQNTTPSFVNTGAGFGVGTTTPSGALHVETWAAATPGLIVKGFTSQSANYFEIQNSALSKLMLFNNSGNLGIGVLGSGAARLHVSAERVLNSGALTEWPAVRPDLQTAHWRNPVIISDGGNGTLNTAGTGTTCGVLLGENYTGRVVVMPWGGGSISPADQGTANGRDMMIMGGSSDNAAGRTGGRLFLQGGPGYPSTGYSGNFGITAIQPLGGNAVVGAATNISGRFQINIGSGTLVGQVIRSFTSQTANLTEWQNTTGYPIALVNASGSLIVASGDIFVNGMTVGKGTGQSVSNVAIGFQALNANTTGSGTVAVGHQAGFSQTARGFNAYLGYQTGYLNMSGSQNTAVGVHALFNNLANNNVALGYRASYSSTSGFQNVAIGNNALFSNAFGFNNVAVGVSSMEAAMGSYNTAVGFETFHTLVSGNQNVAVGYQAGHYQSGGSLSITTANNCVFIGTSTRGYLDNESNVIAVGFRAQGLGSNTTVIGNTDTASGVIYGNINFPNGMKMAGYSNPNSMSRISGNVNNYVFDTRSSIQKILSNGNYNITGISYSSGLAAHEDGKFMRLFNGNGSGGFNITLVHNSASSSAGNKLWCVQTQDIILGPYDYAELTYDTGDFSGASGGAGWRVH